MGTIFLGGIYGVGKSTLAEKLSLQTGIPYYSAGDLISAKNGEQYGANKVVADKDRNQQILVDCVTDLLNQTPRIILAGHFCIVNRHGEVDKLPETVFESLHIEKIILLEASCDAIIANLTVRDSKSYAPELVQSLLETERSSAQMTAKRLNLPLILHQMQYADTDITALLENF